MRHLNNGLYMLPNTGKLVELKDVEIYENVYNETTGQCTDLVALLTWVDTKGEFPKTMIRDDQFKFLVRIGDV